MSDPKKPWQFQKGKSGNPNGRPQKGKSFSDILNNELKKQKQILVNPDTGEERQIDGKTALCLAYIKLAFKGDNENVRASCMEKIMKFIDGDFVQHVDMAASVSSNVLEDIKDGLDKLSQEDRESYLDICEKVNKEAQAE